MIYTNSFKAFFLSTIGLLSRTMLFSVTAFIANPSHCKDLSLLVSELDKIRDQYKVAAYAIVITTPDTVLIAENRGRLRLNSDQEVPKDAYFRVGSITKSFIGLAALIAEQNDLLSIKDPVTQHIGSTLFDNPWQEAAPVTIEQLLQHSAGLPDMSSREEFNHNTEITNRDGLALYAKQRKVRWQPGVYYSYSNTGIGLAALAIENASQLPIDEFLKKQLFTPLNMDSATLNYTQTVKDKLVPGFDSDGITQLPYWHMIFPAFGALNIQPKDMANFIQLYLNRGKVANKTIVSPLNITRAETPTTTLAARSGLSYGYGLGLYNWFRNGHEFFGHGGDGDGYLARFGYSLEADLGYFIVINRFQHAPLQSMQREIEQWMVNDLEPVNYPPVIEPINRQDLIGNYLSTTGRFSRGQAQTMTIFEQEGKLYSRLAGDSAYELIPVSEHLYRRRNEPKATIAIKKSGNGTVFVGDDGNFIQTH